MYVCVFTIFFAKQKNGTEEILFFDDHTDSPQNLIDDNTA